MGNPGKSKKPLNWADDLQAARAEEFKPPSVASGWKTRLQLQAESGYSESHMSKKLNVSVRKGLLETKRFKVWTGQRYYPMVFYRKIK